MRQFPINACTGILRGLMLRPNELLQTVNQCWNDLPHPRERYVAQIAQHCGFHSKGKNVLYDLFRLMMSEHRAYLENIPGYVHQLMRESHPEIPERDIRHVSGFAMAMDTHGLIAWHLAADRTQARLMIEPVPVTFRGRWESWMNISGRRKKTNLVILSLYQR